MNPEKLKIPSQVLHADQEAIKHRLDYFVSELLAAAIDAFGGRVELDTEKMKMMLLDATDLLYVVENLQITAFQVQNIYKTDTNIFLYYSRAVRKSGQGKGLSKKIMQYAIQKFQPTVVGARSQNPAEMLAFCRQMRELNASHIFPFFSDSHDTNYFCVLREELIRLRGASGKVNEKTGLVRSAFSGGKLGDYKIDDENPQIRMIEIYLNSIGFSRLSGDALFYCALFERSLFHK